MAIIVAGGALVALTIPAFGMQTKLPGIESYDKSQPVIQTYLKVQEAFPSEADYATVVVKAADVNAPAVKTAIADLKPTNVEINPAGTVAPGGRRPRRQRRGRQGDAVPRAPARGRHPGRLRRHATPRRT